MCERVFVRRYSFTLVEYDAQKPWIVVATERRTAELDDGVSFSAWAREHWPEERYSVALDPWEEWPTR